MAQRKPYNPNTAYGRKKLREQAQQHYENMPPEEQENHDFTKFIIVLIIVIVVLSIGFACGNTHGALKWLTR